MNLISQPLISVITPVHNNENYLAECIESVLTQTYQNWEYIIVNNCSTDRTPEIAQEYSKKDKRIRIHHNDRFLNVIQNHNLAFRLISRKSKYCKVVHADDWLFPECLMKMVELAEIYPSVSIVGSYRVDGIKINFHGIPHACTIIPGRDICRSTMLGRQYVFGSPTTVLLRSDVIRSRVSFYNERNIHADKEACFDVLQNSDFGFVHQILSFTRRHNKTGTMLAKKLNTYFLGELIVLKKYGPVYLKEQEYRKRLREWTKRYYRFFIKNIFLRSRKRKELWNYYRTELKELGFPISSRGFIKGLFTHYFA
ncbi:MAG: glycosyltransferase family 2 protein [wastewater metagenome]|nr:glycosyltransferase family 2 protein [Candidatus Loosdrechtia aerotolerans]